MPLRLQIVKSAATKQFAAGDAAPRGLTISPSGGLTWTPAHDQLGLHEFQVKITDKGQNTVQTASIEVIVGADDARAVGGDLAKVDSLYRVPLATNSARLVAGLGGTALLVMDGPVVRRLDAAGINVRQTWTLPQAYGWIGERETYFVAMSDQTKSLDIIDKTTMKVTRSLQMDYFRQRDDLAPAPDAAGSSYVSVEKSSDSADSSSRSLSSTN